MKDPLELILNKYSSCNSYIDSGTTTAQLGEKCKFRTYFLRPDKYRFEVVTSFGHEYAVYLDGEKAKIYWRRDMHQEKRVDIREIRRLFPFRPMEFICCLLMPEESTGSFNLEEFLPFQVSEETSDRENHIWLTSYINDNYHEENLLIDRSTNIIKERRMRIKSTEHEAKLNAAKHFEKTDPEFAKKLIEEAQEVQGDGKTYTSVYETVTFDDIPDSVIKEKFVF